MKLTIRVPATSANIGSGFDSVGLALARYNTFQVTFFDEERYVFSGVEPRFCNAEHLFIQTLNRVVVELGKEAPRGLSLVFQGDVPVANGLGSSSTCIVAGAAAALMYVDQEVDAQKLLDLAVKIEGHPDNVAPAILGGVVAGVVTADNFLYHKEEISEHYQFITITPDFEFPTHVARDALPKTLTYEQAIYNISRAALLLPAFAKKDDRLLKEVTKDAIHQTYRLAMISQYRGIIEFIEKLPIVTVFVSGAGATLCLVVTADTSDIVLSKLQDHFQIKRWDVQKKAADNTGIMIEFD